MRRATACLATTLMALGLVGGAAGFVMTVGAESPAARVADSALILVDLAALTALPFLIWPRGAR